MDKRRIAAAGGLTLAASLVTGGSADAATFTVTNTNDSHFCHCAPGTLRQARTTTAGHLLSE